MGRLWWWYWTLNDTELTRTNYGAANKRDIDQRNLNAAINQQLLLQEAVVIN